MKAISLWQPWASLVVLGIKRYETRSRPASSKLWGQTIAIHAAQRNAIGDLSRDDHQVYAATIKVLAEAGFEPRKLPTGAILGTVRLVRSDPTSELVAGIPDHFGDYGPGRHYWTLAIPRILAAPIPWKGSQGWWEIGAEFSAALEEAAR